MGIRSSVALWASFAVLAALSLPTESMAQAGSKSVAAQQKKGSGLPIPRFASLRSDQVNVRTGPGARYPIEWDWWDTTLQIHASAEIGGASGVPSRSRAVGQRWRGVRVCAAS